MPEIENQVLANADHVKDAIATHPDLVLLPKPHTALKSGIIVFKHQQLSNQEVYQHLQKNGVVCAMRGGGVRFSPHFYNTAAEIDRAFALL